MHFFIEHPVMEEDSIYPFEDKVFKVYAESQEEAKNAVLRYFEKEWPNTEIPDLKLGGENRTDVIPLICSVENAARRYFEANAICNNANNILWNASIEMRQIETAISNHLPNGISIVKFDDKQSIWRREADQERAQCLDAAAIIIHDQKEG